MENNLFRNERRVWWGLLAVGDPVAAPEGRRRVEGRPVGVRRRLAEVLRRVVAPQRAEVVGERAAATPEGQKDVVD